MNDYLSENARMILSELRSSSGAVVIFGAGVAGEALFHVCKTAGVQVTCFCDNNGNKTGKLLCGVPVLHFSDIERNFQHPVFLISAADIAGVVEQLDSFGFQNWYEASELLDCFDVNRHCLSVTADFAEYVISTCEVCHRAFRNPDDLFLRSVDLVITERCSLRCRDCANLMQYYEKPQNYRLEEILISVEALSAIVDTVNEIRVIGGEPLMNPVCTDVVEKLIDDPKFRRVIIYTNGTICPPEGTLRRLRHPKVLFFITDYGTLSKNIDRLAQRLDNLKIQSFIRPAQGWTECSSIRLHRRSESDRNAIFGDCCAKHLATLMKGVLYRCPFSAHTTVLGAVPFSPEDFVHILDGERNDRDANLLKRAVREFFLSKRPLKACDFCEGRLYGAPEIEPAAQATHPLDYKRYFRILEERSHSLMSECGNG